MNFFKNTFKKENIKWLFLLFLLFFFGLKTVCNSDEGVILSGAWNLFNKKKLYIDFFEFIPPGSFYFVFWLWKIFKPSFLITKLFSIFLFFLSGIGIYKISNLIKKTNFNFFSVVVFSCIGIFSPLINHNAYNLLLLIWASYFFLKGIESRNNKYFIFSGLFSGFSILVLQQKGLLFVIGSLFFLFLTAIIQKNITYLKNACFYLLFSIIPLSLLLKWSMVLLYENLILFPTEHYSTINKLSYYPIFISLGIIFLMFFIFKKNIKIYYLLLIQIFLLLSTIPRDDLYHISIISFPLLALLPYLIIKINKKNIILKIHYNLLLFFILYLTLSYFLSLMFFFCFNYKKIDIQIINNYIANNCYGEYLYAGPFIPGIYLETKKLNPSPYDTLFTKLNPNSHFIETKQALEKYKPDCVILNYKMLKKFKYNKNNPLDIYIEKKYKIIKQIDNFIIKKRKQ